MELNRIEIERIPAREKIDISTGMDGGAKIVLEEHERFRTVGAL